MFKEKELVIIGMAGADASKDNKKRKFSDKILISDAYTNKNLALEREGINSVQWIINQYLESGFVNEGNFYVSGSNEHFKDANLNGANFFNVNVDLVTNAIKTLEHVLEEKEDEIKSRNKELWIGFQVMDTILLEKEYIQKYLRDVFNFSYNNPNIDMILQAVCQEAAEQNISIKSKPSKKFISYNPTTKKKEFTRAIYGGLIMLARPSNEDRELLKVIGDSMYKHRHNSLQFQRTGIKTSKYLLKSRGNQAFSNIFGLLDLFYKNKMRKLSFDYLSEVASQMFYQEKDKVKVFCVKDADIALGYAGDYDRISDVNTDVSKLKKIRLNNQYLKENYR